MATINLVDIKFNWKGAYNSSTTYAVDDVVSSGGNSYVCIQAHSNQAVGNATAYWNIMSSKGTNGTDADLLNISSTAQGDLYYNSGSAIARLGAGTSGQFLKTLGTGANPVWGSVAGGLLQVKTSFTRTNVNTSNTSYTDTGYSVAITPSSTSSRILLYFQATAQSSGGRNYLTFNRSGYGDLHGDISSSNGIVNYENINSEGNSTANMMYIDHPNTTSAITYKVRYKSSNSTFYLGGHDNSAQILIAMEIDGGIF